MTTQRAAEDFAKAYDEVARWDDALALRYKLKEARALSDLGFYKADEDANRRAIEAYRLAAALAPADKNPAGWVDSQSGLAMSDLGDRRARGRNGRARRGRVDPREPRSSRRRWPASRSRPPSSKPTFRSC